MAIQVCKFIEVTRKSLHCVGTKEFRTCNDVVETTEEPVCGTADTFELACKDMERNVQNFLTKQCPSYLGCRLLTKQSATDLGPSFWEQVGQFLVRVSAGCSIGDPVGW